MKATFKPGCHEGIFVEVQLKQRIPVLRIVQSYLHQLLVSAKILVIEQKASAYFRSPTKDIKVMTGCAQGGFRLTNRSVFSFGSLRIGYLSGMVGKNALK
jgi:hypothetical protein